MQHFIATYGYLAVFILMVAESACIPVPSELIMTLGGALAAGVLKIPELFGPLGSGIRGQILLGSILSGVGAYFAVRFLVRYLRTRTLIPFGIYCLVAGLASVVYLGFVK